jgi:hypothetical protein
MKNHKSEFDRIRGWLPKEPIIAYASKAFKPRWRETRWIAFTLVAIVGLAFATYTGAQIYLRYSNPKLDVTSGYYEKTLNCTTANVGDVVEVYVLVGWHGYVIPEFTREVKIVDPYLENSFELVGGNNTYGYSGYGGGDQFTYLLKVIGNDTQSIEMPKPRLYLDGSEICLNGTNAVLEIQTVSESEI